MGAPASAAWLLLDAVSSAQRFIDVFVDVYILLIFAYVLTSWIRLPHSLNRVQRFLYDVVDPYLRLYRRILPPLGPLDLSPVVAVVVLFVLRTAIIRLLGRLD